MADGPVAQRCSSMKNRLPTGGPEYRERERGRERERERERESNKHEITASDIYWESSTTDDQAPHCFCLVAYVYSLSNLVHLLGCPAHIDRRGGPVGQNQSCRHTTEFGSFTTFSQPHCVTHMSLKIELRSQPNCP